MKKHKRVKKKSDYNCIHYSEFFNDLNLSANFPYILKKKFILSNRDVYDYKR